MKKLHAGNIPAELTATILGLRAEKHLFDRLISLLTFSSWLQYPDNPAIVQQSRVLASANVLVNKRLSQRQKSALANKELDHQLVAGLLLNPPEMGSFSENFEFNQEALFDAASIAEFFAIWPDEDMKPKQPSFNRALHFIDGGGFVTNPTAPKNQQIGHQSSKTTIKKSWRRYAVSGPFIFAAEVADLLRIIDLAPDDPASITDGEDILRDRKILKVYFETARAIQERMLQFLDEKTKARFPFVNFPKGVTIATLYREPLKPHQLALLHNYRAPIPA